MVDPHFLRGAGRVVGDVVPGQKLFVGREDFDARVAFGQGRGGRGRVRAEADVDEVARALDRQDRDHVVPAVVARAWPVAPGGDGLAGFVDARAGWVDRVAEREQDRVEEARVLHAVAAAAAGISDDFLEEVRGGEADGVVGGVVQVEVFPGDVGEEVFLEGPDEGEAGGGVRCGGVVYYGVRAVLWGQLD